MVKLIISTAIFIAVAGCASSVPQDVESPTSTAAVANVANNTATADTEGDRMICRRESITGSHRVEKICRLKSDIDKERQATQLTLRNMNRGISGTGNAE